MIGVLQTLAYGWVVACAAACTAVFSSLGRNAIRRRLNRGRA